jgi:hypothetical protein
MSAVFSALFGTPLTAALFALEVISVGVFYYSGLVPCIVSALTAYAVTKTDGHRAHPLYSGHAAAVGKHPVARRHTGGYVRRRERGVLRTSCTIRSELAERLYARTRLSAPLWAARLILRSPYAVGSTDYNGTGMDVITSSPLSRA